jgi:hypothetical protein
LGQGCFSLQGELKGFLGAEVATYGTVKDCPQYGAQYNVCYPTCP